MTIFNKIFRFVLFLIQPLLLVGMPLTEARADSRLKVVASIRPVALLVEDIGGEAVEVSTLLAPGVDLHHFEIRPSQRLELMRAPLVVLHGAGVETWAHGLKSELGDRLLVLFPTSGPGASHGGPSEPDEPSEQNGPSVPDGPSEQEHSAGEGDKMGGAGSGMTYHWLSPKSLIGAAPRLAEMLCAKAHTQCEGFRKRASELVGRLNQVDASWRQVNSATSNPSPRGNIWLSHPLYGEFAKEYGLVQRVVNLQCESSVISPAELKQLYQLFAENPPNLLFIEAGSSKDIGRLLPSGLNLRLVELDSMGVKAKTLVELLMGSGGRVMAEFATNR